MKRNCILTLPLLDSMYFHISFFSIYVDCSANFEREPYEIQSRNARNHILVYIV